MLICCCNYTCSWLEGHVLATSCCRCVASSLLVASVYFWLWHEVFIFFLILIIFCQKTKKLIVWFYKN
ncbi:hypothetical protein AQUCO_00800123v1 [Aquilegia coerulea]|uniref:Uncharacterized protein n=1 Tax=Aquilegia coerulea TaxID=218851 RepID=A0A2G5EHJ8_AQUCA|nr:hypothetical protein AQUCO_00800123v1 [Aquilegia coerulea]